MNITAITYKNACDILGSKYNTVVAATERGVFTKIPVTTPEQKIIKEQVELFKGKKQLRLSSLDREERKIWEQLEELALTRNQEVHNVVHQNTGPKIATMPLFNLDRSALEYLDERKLTMRAETAAGTMSFHSALIDEPVTDSNEDEQDQYGEWVNSLNEAVAILLGLVLLLFVLYLTKREASKQAEQTIEKIGLEREDLATNQREAIEKLRSHPVEAQKLRRILEKEDLLVA